MFSNGSRPRVFIAIVLASSLVAAGLVHVSFAQIPAAGGNNNNSGKNNNNNTYSNLQFGIEKIEIPKGWTRTIQEQNNTAGTAADEVTITLKLENATTTSPSSSSSSGVANPFSLFSMFSSPTSGNNNSNSSSVGGFSNDNTKSGPDPFAPTITIKLQKGEALQRVLAAEQNQTGAGQQQGQEIDLFAQNPYCKQLNSVNGSETGSNATATATIINGHNFKVTEQECDVAPILKLFLRAFYASLANLANNATAANQNNNNSSSLILDGSANTTNNSSSNGTDKTDGGASVGNNNATAATTANNNTDAGTFTAFLDTLHNITTTEKKYTYTSPSSNLRVELSYSALTFVSVDDFEIKAKHYQRYLPVFEELVHSTRIQQIK